MRRVSLNGAWEVRRRGDDEWLDARVPGGVYADLRDAGAIPDPLAEGGEDDLAWVGESDWEYRTRIDVDPAILERDRVLLQCEGLDAVATVFVDGVAVGSTANMHVGRTFDVTDVLTRGETEVGVCFRSPVDYARERAAEAGDHDRADGGERPPETFVRKAQCHFGRDWAPRLPTVGIYRDVSLVAFSGPRIASVTVDQDHAGDGVALTVRACVEATEAGEYVLSAAVAGREATETVSLDEGRQDVTLALDVGDVDLWWPAGYGDQPLYGLEVGVAGEGGEHTVRERVGFREIDLDDGTDGEDGGFVLRVNGTRVFLKGATVVPPSPFHGVDDAPDFDRLVSDAAAANANALRVSGAGYYPPDAFYERCDELGILVWQDFMFDGGPYPAEEAFLDTVAEEVRHQVRRLATHPSVAIWCGGNETTPDRWDRDAVGDDHETALADYRALFEDAIPRVCRAEDPGRPYWPSSPSTGFVDGGEPAGDGDRRQAPGPDAGTDRPRPDRGVAHVDAVRTGSQPIEYYNTVDPRFVSAVGYPSFPSPDALDGLLDSEERNPTAPAMDRRWGGETGTLLAHLAERFRYPADLADFCYLTQVLQGVATRTAIGHWRRNEATTGTLYRRLDAVRPGPACSALEYDGSWKAQQYVARRQFAPVLVSFSPTYAGYGTDDDGRQRWGPVESQTLWVTSDVPAPVDGTVVLEVIDVTERTVVHEEAFDVALEAQGNRPLVTVGRSDLPDGLDPSAVMLRAAYEGDGESYPAVGFLARYKALALSEPTLDVTVDGRAVTVASEDATLFVALDADGPAGAFSDNYFHLEPGARRTVTFEPFGAADRDRPAFDAVTARHLRDRS